ncbi:MAG: cell division protein SepF [Actinomycetota bacterium]|nr:cell division protein SepF [Actinomycetota bacterium]
MASVWRRTMVYLGLVDDEEYEDYEPYEEVAPPPPAPVPRRQAAVRQAPADPVFEPEPPSGGVRTLPREPDTGGMTVQRPAVVRPIVTAQQPKVHVVAPNGFNDAQEIGDKLKASQPVILNLQGVNRDLSRRLIDFASGLTYGLGGQMERVAEQVFLLTPSNVEVPAEEKRRLQERGLYRA